jgi:hypothetical protein
MDADPHASGPAPALADADLARVVEAWPSLPPAIRAAVLAVVASAQLGT